MLSDAQIPFECHCSTESSVIMKVHVLGASYMIILYCCWLLFSSSLKMVQLRRFVKLLRKEKMITRLAQWCMHMIIGFLNMVPRYVYSCWFCTIMICGRTCTCTCKIKVDLCKAIPYAALHIELLLVHVLLTFTCICDIKCIHYRNSGKFGIEIFSCTWTCTKIKRTKNILTTNY